MITTTLRHPWLIADLGQPHRVLSFAPWRAGFATTRRIAWREVRNADLPPGLDVDHWFQAELTREGLADSVAMLTSRNITTFTRHDVRISGGPAASCIATVGLGNAERVGHRLGRVPKSHGTINITVATDTSLTDTALIEALSIAAEARTTAVLGVGLRTARGLATGTGTDCIAVAAPVDTGEPSRWAGLHTPLGEAIGAAVFHAVRAGAEAWMRENNHQLPPADVMPL